MKRLLVLTTATLSLVLSAPASAKPYTVRACVDGQYGNASWTPHIGNGFMTAYTSCPGEGIVTRMNGGPGNAPNYSDAWHQLTAPPGTRIVHVAADFHVESRQPWYAGLVTDNGQWIWCGSSFPNCSTWGTFQRTGVWMDTSWVRAQVVCFSGNGCPRGSQQGLVSMKNVEVTIEDPTPPSVTMTGGSLLTPGWHREDQDVQVASSDATGVQQIDLLIDGNQPGGSVNGRCDWASPRPCDDLSRSTGVPTKLIKPDGRHTLTARAIDAAGNVGATSREIYIDNTPPAQALDARLDGGDGWRPRNSFQIGWRNPVESAAPIGAVRYSMCPAANLAGNRSNCVDGVARARSIAAIADLRVPRPGEWRVRLWLEDEAGNADPERAVAIGVLRLDDDVPTLRIAAFDEQDPTRVRVLAQDATSGIASGQIEAKREGEDAWRSLPTNLDRSGFTATLDDETLPRGRYVLRARVADYAGNERSTTLLANGDPATRTLPLRIGTRLAVGAPKRIRGRNANGKVRYRTVLRVSPRARFGRTIPLRGRLTMPGANPVANANVEVWERVKLPAADWRQVGMVTTTRTGRFRFKALRGPSRTLRFRYPGTATIRSRTTQVDLGVRAATSFRPSRKRVVNGEEIRFHGRLKGRQTAETGKLLHLQVFTRGRWSTFATPRADRTTGLWRHAYRFSATRGLVRYRFRVLIPREATFPYETGVTRSVRVTVRGL